MGLQPHKFLQKLTQIFRDASHISGDQDVSFLSGPHWKSMLCKNRVKTCMFGGSELRSICRLSHSDCAKQRYKDSKNRAPHPHLSNVFMVGQVLKNEKTWSGHFVLVRHLSCVVHQPCHPLLTPPPLFSHLNHFHLTPPFLSALHLSFCGCLCCWPALNGKAINVYLPLHLVLAPVLLTILFPGVVNMTYFWVSTTFKMMKTWTRSGD